MKSTLQDITILCKVVDNFGDIGVVYRLARALSEILPLSTKIRIVADNLESFNLLCPKVNPNEMVQTVNNWKIFQWNAQKLCFEEFSKNPPQLIIECFQCGRPSWLEKLLFEVKLKSTVYTIMLDYLTAEDYAETFHKLKSLTRSARVQKVNFMPGFTSKTGGLILDRPFLSSIKEAEKLNSKKDEKNCDFNVLFFSYPKKLIPVVSALETFNEKVCKKSLLVKLAQGAGKQSFEDAVSRQKTSFSVRILDFLPQEEWDFLLCSADLLFVRGEDSLSRACLCGKPFVWHAYPQSENYQLVKVQALLSKMKPFFDPDVFLVIEKCFLIYNDNEKSSEELESSVAEFLLNFNQLKKGFKDFSSSLLLNGNLAQNLIEFAQTYIAEHIF